MSAVACGLRWAAAVVLLVVLAWPVSSTAQSLPSTTYGNELNAGPGSFEARFGAFAHGVGSLESGSVDINGELVFPRLWTVDPEWNWLIPRPHVGFMANTDGRTSYGYGGGLWTFNLTPKFFLEGFVGGAIHNGSLDGDSTHNALGCRVLFHVGGSAGYRFMPHWSVMATFDHISNGNAVLGACSNNVGLNEYGVRLGYEF